MWVHFEQLLGPLVQLNNVGPYFPTVHVSQSVEGFMVVEKVVRV